MELLQYVSHTTVTLSDITSNDEVLPGVQEAIEIGKQLVQACQDVGFAYFRNTGIPQAEVDSMFEWVCTLTYQCLHGVQH